MLTSSDPILHIKYPKKYSKLYCKAKKNQIETHYAIIKYIIFLHNNVRINEIK